MATNFLVDRDLDQAILLADLDPNSLVVREANVDLATVGLDMAVSGVVVMSDTEPSVATV